MGYGLSRHGLVLLLATASSAMAGSVNIIKQLPAVLSKPGTYMFNGSLSCDQKEGACITVTSDDVTIDMQSHHMRCTYPSASKTILGIEANFVQKLTVTSGTIEGCLYGIRVTDTLEDGRYTPTHGYHTIKNMVIRESLFRGIRTDGYAVSIEGNKIFDTGGTTYYKDSFAMGIEVVGPGNRVLLNQVYNTVPSGKGEGVGISVSDCGPNSLIANNQVINSNFYPATYGLWVGGNDDGQTSDVLVFNNTVQGYDIGIGVSTPTHGYKVNNQYIDVSTPEVINGDWLDLKVVQTN